MRWYNAMDPQKAINCDDLCREFLCQYLCNTDLTIILRDLKLIKQELKEGFSDYLARWRVNIAHMVDRPSEAD